MLETFHSFEFRDAPSNLGVISVDRLGFHYILKGEEKVHWFMVHVAKKEKHTSNICKERKNER